IPFNNYLTGATAFTHKAGVHTKAVLADPRTYEIIDPDVFGVERTIAVAHALTGRAAVAARARALGLTYDAETLRAVTDEVKRRADAAPITDAELDLILESWATIGGGGLQPAEPLAQAEAY